MTTGIPPILLVGCGRMGSAMLSGWREWVCRFGRR